MKEELLRFNKKQKYIIFDYETCNLNLISTKNAFKNQVLKLKLETLFK